MNSGTVYIPVQANEVMPMAEGGSSPGGYQVEGYYINWDSNGITGISWPTMDNLENYVSCPPNNPFGDYTEDDIRGMIEAGSNLDNIFREWKEKYNMLEEIEFISWAGTIFGLTENGGGCIGEQLA